MGTFSHHWEETSFLAPAGIARANWTEISAGILEYFFFFKESINIFVDSLLSKGKQKESWLGV